MRRAAVLALLLAVAGAAAQQGPVIIHIDAAGSLGEYKPDWNFFGADEPNYTYAPNGTKLLKELAAIDKATPVYFRPHNLLTTGDGSASLKWGSTNVYTETSDGKPVYDWAITDKIFDNFAATGVRPMVEIGFMPEALSPHPEPYRHNFPKGDIATGWSYPPKDYGKWRALIVAWVTHLQQRYGAATDTWLWEVWNEPDISYFHGTLEDYEKLYDITTGAVRQVLPHAKVGGPGATGPYPQDDPAKNNPFFHDFLEHTAHGINADTGKPGVPLDFISFHPKGRPKFMDGHVRMNLAPQMGATDLGMKIVSGFPEYRRTPIILSETDPEGCAACKGPQNGYRNGPLYGVSIAEMLARSAELARLHRVNLEGGVTWAFEFMDQPWFAGFRELATNGIDKPVLSVFRMFGMLHGTLLPLSSSGEIPIAEIIQHSVTGSPDVTGIATRSGNSLDILLWNYQDEDVDAPAAAIALTLSGLPTQEVKTTEYRMDHNHSNAYAQWLKMGSPQHPSLDQVALLEKASKLEILSQGSVAVVRGSGEMSLSLPRQAVSLLHVEWK